MASNKSDWRPSQASMAICAPIYQRRAAVASAALAQQPARHGPIRRRNRADCWPIFAPGTREVQEHTARCDICSREKWLAAEPRIRARAASLFGRGLLALRNLITPPEQQPIAQNQPICCASSRHQRRSTPASVWSCPCTRKRSAPSAQRRRFGGLKCFLQVSPAWRS